jgi:hypothetical protein
MWGKVFLECTPYIWGIWFFFFNLKFLRQLDWQSSEENNSQICLEVKDKSFKNSNPNYGLNMANSNVFGP